MPLGPGSVIGDYQVLGILGAGGMGQVYKVQNLISNRTEAMKILLSDLHAQPQQVERFLREIQVQASLVHPHIASLYTASRLDDQLLMFIEFVEGETLASMLTRGPLPVEQAVQIATQVLSALAYAHERGVVHRDIKPSNIMLAAGGVAKLLDFGLAAGRGDKRLTQTGNVVGSLNYMSPEQVRGEAPTASSDIYALGLTLYETLTGKQGIEGPSDFAVMSAQLLHMPDPPVRVNPAVPAALSEIVLKAVAKAPAERFGSALELQTALERCKDLGMRATSPMPQAAPLGPAGTVRRPSAEYRAPGSAGYPQVLTSQTYTSPSFTPPAASSQALTEAAAREKRQTILAIVGSLAGAAVLLTGGALGYRYWQTHRPASPIASIQPPSISAPAPAPEPVPPEPVAGQPPPPAPVKQIDPLAKKEPAQQKKSAEKEPPPPPVTVVPPPPAATQPVVATPPPAKTAVEQQAEEWARVGDSRDPVQLRRFLAAYPNGPFAAQAKEMLADVEWENLRKTEKPELLREFATQFPFSSHAQQALNEAARLENRQAVRDTLVHFQEAFSARDLNTVRRLWPTANGEILFRFAELFRQSRTVVLTLRPLGDLRISGGRADVTCHAHLVFQEGFKPRTMESTVRIELVRANGGWVIDTAVEAPPPAR